MALYRNSRRTRLGRMGRRSYKMRPRSYKRKGRYATIPRKRSKMVLYRNPMKLNVSKTTLIYNTVITIDPNAKTTAGNYVFCANGLYDVDITGIGHQPMYFDNYAALYSKYRVNYAKITCTVMNHFVNTATGTGAGNTLTTTPNYSYKLWIVTDNQSIDLPSETNQLIEEGSSNVKWRFVAPQLNGKLPKLYSFCSPHRLCGVDFKDDILKSEVTANPQSTGLAYFIVGISSADDVTDPPAVSINVNLKFWVEFFDRKVSQAQN